MTKYNDAIRYLGSRVALDCDCDDGTCHVCEPLGVIREALSKAEQFDKLVEARKRATAGRWYVDSDQKGDWITNGKADIAEPCPEADIGMEHWHQNADFITTTANILEPYARIHE